MLSLLNSLNPAQREAVTAPPGHTLVLAGAGSGKTKVLIHRIAWLLATGKAHPHNILAVTFTNKAANEMRARLDSLLQSAVPGPWIGTFHGLAHRLLRIHWQAANLPQSFQVLDSDDQLRTIKRVLKFLELSEDIYVPSDMQHFINTRKDQGLRARELVVEGETRFMKMLDIYLAYENICQRTGLVDFAELLLRSYELLRDNQELREYYQQRFTFLLVDEFQDTNTLQYQWLRVLAGGHGNVFVVFDDDQLIYSWRGSRMENIQNFSHDFPHRNLFRLEQNYRSTGTILAAANALIAHNTGRLGKTLWTQSDAGRPVHLYHAYNELEEAEFVTAKIQDWSGPFRDLAILYRTSAQSRVFEEALLRKQIPYRIYGGLRFYERAEIKDVMAYLRLILRRENDGAFERIINTPRRGIGEKTVELVRSMAKTQHLSLWTAAGVLIEGGDIKAKAKSSLAKFLQQIEQLAQHIQPLPLHQQIESVKRASGLIEHYGKEGPEEAQRRLENLDELVAAAREFEKGQPDDNSLLSEFLAHAALESGEGQASEFDDCVQLMTLHAAKGLEFSTVFLCGLEEGLFPHQNSLLDSVKLEEERRLCYVGITRARHFLSLCYSDSRYRYGARLPARPSRFIQEIPVELIEEVRFRGKFSPFKKRY